MVHLEYFSSCKLEYNCFKLFHRSHLLKKQFFKLQFLINIVLS